MEYQVTGENISSEEVSEEFGGQHASSRRATARRAATSPNVTADMPRRNEAASRGRGNVTSRIIRASWMPQLPKEDFKIIIRPKGGLDIAKTGPTVVADAILLAASLRQKDQDTDTICPNLQKNIVVASTPKRENADRYIVNERNPLALAAKRIGSTTTAIVAFDRLKVPNFVRYGPALVRCSLYREEVDICYACGRLGHRAEVCPTPGNPICRGCGIPKPDMSHQCTPKCKLCGGEHQTGDKKCKHRFHIPYIIRRRRWDRARAAAEMENDEGRSTEQSVKPPPNTAQEYPSLRRLRSTSRSRPESKGRSRSLSRPDPDPEYQVNPQTSTSPRSRLELSAGPAQSRDLIR
ncbi:hypothetical protein HPB50_022456 [Hyalomma asiaticum]|uniref:Uncharacterized protein n=1 Tax=Hyalomma asiaticum TaxID=266040 RepID=A0ACB7TPD2_HYAAI|nr:hypothetical protein HPB50_022456 [Hyalomma asiaticum]